MAQILTRLAITGAAVALVACATPKVEQPFATAQEAAAACTLTDDPMATSILVHCAGRRGFGDAWTAEHIASQRRYLMATVDRRTSVATYSVALMLSHSGRQPATFTSGTYLRADLSPTSAPVHPKLADVFCSRHGCAYDESAFMIVDQADLRTFARTHPPSTYWRVRFSGRDQVDLLVPVTELQGFLAATDAAIAQNSARAPR